MGSLVTVYSKYQNQMDKAPQTGEKTNNELKRRARIVMYFLHMIFYFSLFLVAYALITLNVPLMIFLALLAVTERYISKSRRFVKWITDYAHPSNYFDSFSFIDDDSEPTDENSRSSVSETQEKYLFAFHPHSVYAMSVLCCMNNPEIPAFDNMTGLASSFALDFPIIGAIFKLWGASEASNSNVKRLMKQGKDLGLVPGGFQEATVTSPDQLRCWIRGRKGFIKYALDYDYKICPVLILGEHQAFWTFQMCEKIRLWLNRFKIPGVIFWNKLTGLLIPSNLNITMIKGRAINLNQDNVSNPKPSKELVDQTHKEYMDQIERLYAKYKHLNNNIPLKIY